MDFGVVIITVLFLTIAFVALGEWAVNVKSKKKKRVDKSVGKMSVYGGFYPWRD